MAGRPAAGKGSWSESAAEVSHASSRAVSRLLPGGQAGGNTDLCLRIASQPFARASSPLCVEAFSPLLRLLQPFALEPSPLCTGHHAGQSPSMSGTIKILPLRGEAAPAQEAKAEPAVLLITPLINLLYLFVVYHIFFVSLHPELRTFLNLICRKKNK